MKLRRLLQAWFNVTFRRRKIDAIVEELQFKDGDLTIFFKHRAFAEFAKDVAAWFVDCGGINYVEFTVFDPASMQAFRIMVQKQGRPSQAEVVEGLRQALWDITFDPGATSDIARRTLEQYGYLSRGEKAD